MKERKPKLEGLCKVAAVTIFLTFPQGRVYHPCVDVITPLLSSGSFPPYSSLYCKDTMSPFIFKKKTLGDRLCKGE